MAKLVKVGRENENVCIPNDAVLAAKDLILQRVMPIKRQSAKWNIRALKAPFDMLRFTLLAS